MPRRIDIELTSALSDGSWTWRAAGAKNPRGTVESSVLPDDAKVGDELKVEIEQGLDGMEILSVIKGRQKSAPELLELLPVEENFQAVIETRAKRDRNDRGGREGRDGKRGGGRRDGRRRDGEGRGDGRDGDGRRDGRGGEGRGDRGPRRPHFEAPPELPKRPKPKRLRPGRDRRNEVLAGIPEAQRGIAELALQGMPAVRTRVAEENKRLEAEGKPTMPEASVLKMAEEMLPKLRVADWLDRADAAQRQMDDLDLRDIRSVVAAGEDPVVARDESTRAINDQLKKDLARKQDEELKLWLEDVDAALEVGRSIRALRLSSQPPKAGVMFPPELARKLGAAATAGLTPEDSADRWSAVMEAAAFSPVRTLVTPTAPPEQITDELRATALRLGPLLPQIAALLGVDVPPGTPRPKPLRPNYGKDRKKTAARRDGGNRDGGDRDGGGRGSDGRDSGRGRDGGAGGGRPKKKAAAETAATTDVAQVDAETPGTADTSPSTDQPAEALHAGSPVAVPESEPARPTGSGSAATTGSAETTPSTEDGTSDAAASAETDSSAATVDADVEQIDSETPAATNDDRPTDEPAEKLMAETTGDTSSDETTSTETTTGDTTTDETAPAETSPDDTGTN